MEWYLLGWRRAFDISGRSRRKEYWMFMLLNIVAMIGIGIVESIFSNSGEPGALLGIYFLAAIIPMFTVTIRRLHDIGRSGWWYFVTWLPFGNLVLLYWHCQPGQMGANQWGIDPKKEEQILIL